LIKNPLAELNLTIDGTIVNDSLMVRLYDNTNAGFKSSIPWRGPVKCDKFRPITPMRSVR
jgi:hypothetical protein